MASAGSRCPPLPGLAVPWRFDSDVEEEPAEPAWGVPGPLPQPEPGLLGNAVGGSPPAMNLSGAGRRCGTPGDDGQPPEPSRPFRAVRQPRRCCRALFMMPSILLALRTASHRGLPQSCPPVFDL